MAFHYLLLGRKRVLSSRSRRGGGGSISSSSRCVGPKDILQRHVKYLPMMPVSFLTAIQMILSLYPGLEIIPSGHLQL